MLLVATAKAVTIVTTSFFVVATVAALLGLDGPGAAGSVAVAIVFLLSFGVTARWLFRTVRKQRSYRQARAVLAAFVVFSPFALLIAMPFGMLPGGYAAELLGTPFALPGALVGVTVVYTLLVFAPTALLVSAESSNTEGSENADPSLRSG